MEKFRMAPDTLRFTSVRDSIVYRDTTLFIEIPGEARIDSIPIPCPPPPPEYIPDTAVAETDFAIAKAWWSYPFIALYLEQKKSTIEFRLDSAVTEIYRLRQENETIKQVLETKHIPKIYKYSLGICIALFALVFIVTGWKLYKFIKTGGAKG